MPCSVSVHGLIDLIYIHSTLSVNVMKCTKTRMYLCKALSKCNIKCRKTYMLTLHCRYQSIVCLHATECDEAKLCKTCETRGQILF